ncbi:MAG: DUF1835 domain-containing protein [Gammaproteobacteria bacterium]|nr:DUF1835 domain-containing protein [Gammaproteobacteria bacterium]
MHKPTTPSDNPFRINLQQQKKRAKELLKSIHTQDSAARLRFINSHPDFKDNSPPADTMKLSDAQLVIAREFGLASWAKLKTHILNMTHAVKAIDTNLIKPDADCATLHIRCGTDLQNTLPDAGFIGDFLEYTDPYSQGPIIHDDDFLTKRIKFLHDSFAHILNMSAEETKQRYERSHFKLTKAAETYKRIVLWFEHDSFDQLILARLLAYFAEFGSPDKLELISINHFPGSVRFIGLGQLPVEAIRMLWSQRKAVNQQQLELAKQLWQALGRDSPENLLNIINSKEIQYLPEMHGALQRHLQELPSRFNGLSLTEHLTLEILNQHSMTAAMLFKKLMLEYEPLPWLGDGMYWFILESMIQVSAPVFDISKADLQKPWPKRTLTITQTGRNVVSGKQDWLSLEPPSRYLGGILIQGAQSCWRWHREKDNLRISVF